MEERSRDLLLRTHAFAKRVRGFVNRVPRTLASIEDAKQLVRSSGSVAANYLEAQEGLSRKDFFYRIKVCRKEARESGLWLSLLEVATDPRLEVERVWLMDEADQQKRIFSSIAGKDDASGSE